MSLCVDVIPSYCCNVLKVSDSSTFTTEVVTGLSLSITPPGFTDPVVFSGLTSTFINNYNSVDLGVTADITDLPDGVYTLLMSATVDGVVQNITKYHLKTCKILSCYNDQLCKIKTETCEPSSNTNTKLKDLFYIRMLIDAAVSKVEYCDATDQGMQMLEYANKLLEKYQSGVCITCK